MKKPRQFKDEAEEAAYWATHGPSEHLLEQFEDVPEEGDDELPPARPRKASRTTAIRLDEEVIARLRRLAGERGKPYQTLLKEFVLERLYEEEKRTRVIG